uniref:DNA polymerase delta subunit OB-fold domain-containing protein n=1 Tax=Chromera velia CCMP2878 TaxID=1169474 RepID=A0A0G4FN87_9ALVE|mmetsp:Transcript_33085/g.65635  ORF Transcript_33085/g.65635 Transcript_33085/m.65635 type:complete len:534 (+) Transcript_33085:252-1853(+)|eukprot:Cvel_17820.t1-p1 / transcript=Cvel_17820.t1 / gene=Cvel_17820 / organism=Chromera_velia_CCMP2878 / gene_product=DNA polymerase delta small subunit, putative / transcript_product=DNA polymerase delta small subunit, putative / location=Cvel_scaffold1444:7174-10068(-) / protein_length=533 / sequence_SO=supercontig / SO=protein_coding / is_pseudo=false
MGIDFPSDWPTEFLQAPVGLEKPSSFEEEQEGENGKGAQTIVRRASEFQNFSARFYLKHRTYTQQYSQVYYIRLHTLRKDVMETAQAKWSDLPEKRFLPRILEAHPNMECVIIGTTYKNMTLKPSVFDSLAQKSKESVGAIPRKSFLSPDDYIALEDETSRVRLSSEGTELQRKLLTGCVIAVRGALTDSGDFKVSDWTFAGAPIPLPLPKVTASTPPRPPFVAFVSGLRLGCPSLRMQPLVLLRDFLFGTCASPELSADVVRLVICGNILGEPSPVSQRTAAMVAEPPQGAGKGPSAADAFANEKEMLKEADAFISQLASVIPVDLMPGEGDPSGFLLPQQPIHPSLFPTAAKNAALTGVTNPFHFEVGGVSFLGTSGQPLSDGLAFSEAADECQCLETFAHARHLAPTAPDTLPCYPFTIADPLAIPVGDTMMREKVSASASTRAPTATMRGGLGGAGDRDEEEDSPPAPHVIFSGNSKEFSVKRAGERTEENPGGLPLCVCVPEFADNPTLVLVSLMEPLEVRTLSFGLQ